MWRESFTLHPTGEQDERTSFEEVVFSQDLSLKTIILATLRFFFICSVFSVKKMSRASSMYVWKWASSMYLQKRASSV
jgi:hypothetical protein